MKRRLLGSVLMAALAAAVVFAVAGRSGTGTPSPTRATPAGRPDRFAYLAAQRGNRCDLQAREILAYPDSRRLQGSCCTRMDEASYRWQKRQLRAYRRIAEIPSDPYDIPAPLAKHLLGLDSSISLNPRQAKVYGRAMHMARERGPCCCRCWRWNAFAGLGRYLIARRRWSAPELGHLIEALDGCGGRSDALGSSARS